MASHAYDSNVGHGLDWESKDQWIEEKVEEWIGDAEKIFSDLGPELGKKEMEFINENARLYYKAPLGSEFILKSGLRVIRVPGGWMNILMTPIGVTSCFIPFDNEFIQEVE